MKHIRLPDIFHRYRPLPILSVMVLSVLLLAFSSPQPGKTTVQTTSQPGDASSVDIPSSLEQCLNGTLDNPVFCTGDELTPDLGWSSSDGTELNSHWSEGQSVPFRFHVSGLAAGAHHLILQYSFTTLTGEHVYDYLTSFNRSLPDASACLPGDLTVDCLVSSTLPIPKDMDLPACVTTQHDPKGSSIVQVPGVLTMYNGYLTSAEYLDSHKCFGSGIEASLAVTFTVSQDNTDVVLAWGGHLAADYDWGNRQGGFQAGGAPYQMRVVSLDGLVVDQSRSLSSSAIYHTDMALFAVPPDNGEPNTPTFARVQLLGDRGGFGASSPPLTGELNFYVCADNTRPYEAPFSNGCDHSSGIQINDQPIPVSGDGEYVSPAYTPQQYGYYCFRSEFIPTADSPYTFARASNSLTTGPEAACYLLTGPTPIILSGFSAHDGSQRVLLTLSIVVLAIFSLATVSLARKGS